ncbi:hypothetical protein [Streptomyces sp. NPDC056660]|uniref:hypothetical protein n=1 Tax=Streptomyces sp. NPDC056660 TaxID=3345897 RepID=UPI003692E672
MSVVQEIPHELSRVSVDSTVRDRFGMPVARLRGRAHGASGTAAEFMPERCVDRVTELGTVNVFVADASLHPTNGGFNPGLTAVTCALRVAAPMP